ncbi:MAG: hypothetical protein ACT4P6_21755 [Gemmatimonadaceae bacterium]
MSHADVWLPRDSWCALVLAAVAIAASAMSVTSLPAGVFQDDGMYVVLARSIAEGEGYRFTNLPNAPHGVHYPPLYPLWLALLWKLAPSFPANVQLFKLANSLLLGVGAVGAFVLARRRLGFGTWSAALAATAGAACAPLVWLSAMVLSEPAFLAALFPVLLLAERAARPGASWRTAMAAGGAVGGLALLRSLGMFILPALALALVMQRRWRHAALALATGALVLGPWQLWTLAYADEIPPAFVGKYGSYFGWVVEGMREGGFAYVAAILKVNAKYSSEFLTGSLGLAATPWMLRAVAIAVLLGLLTLGARELLRRAPVTAGFLALYVSIVLVWPFPPHRFYWGIMPLLVLTPALGIRYLRTAVPVPRRAYRSAVLIGAVALFALYARPNLLGKPRWDIADEEAVVADRSRAAALWVSRHTAPDDIIATEDDVLVHLYTGRRAIPLATFTPAEHLRPQTTAFASATLDSLLHTYPIRWVLPVSIMHINTALALTNQEPAILNLRHALKVGAVFEHVRQVGAQP